MLFQQITGQPSVLYYAEQVFEAAGYDSSQGAGVSVILGSFKILMTGFAVKYVDTLGRRPLLLGGVAVDDPVHRCARLVLPDAHHGGRRGRPHDGADVPRGNLHVCRGVSGIVWSHCVAARWGDFPSARAQRAVGAATLTNFFSNFLVSLYLPAAINQFGTSGTYFLFSVCGVVAMSSIYLTVPETKGKTLEEIEDQMTK